MLEMLINPKRAQKRSWEMFLIGLVYGSLSIILVNWIFGEDAVLAKYSGILIITFCVMFSMPRRQYHPVSNKIRTFRFALPRF